MNICYRVWPGAGGMDQEIHLGHETPLSTKSPILQNFNKRIWNLNIHHDLASRSNEKEENASFKHGKRTTHYMCWISFGGRVSQRELNVNLSLDSSIRITVAALLLLSDSDLHRVIEDEEWSIVRWRLKQWIDLFTNCSLKDSRWQMAKHRGLQLKCLWWIQINADEGL